MRLLLDENLNWRLKRSLAHHEVESGPLLGWAGIQNGALLKKAVENGFDVLITMDNNMPYQQNISRYAIAVVAFRSTSNRLADTEPLMPQVIQILSQIQKGTWTLIE